MSQVLNLRGTSGSGKSYIVKSLMALYDSVEPEMVPGQRKQPLAYLCHRSDGASLYVVGHYETACGGCDTISKELLIDGEQRNGLELVYYLINRAIAAGHDVIFEGLIVASDKTRCIDLKRRSNLMVIGLSTPLDECVKSIQGTDSAAQILQRRQCGLSSARPGRCVGGCARPFFFRGTRRQSLRRRVYYGGGGAGNASWRSYNLNQGEVSV
jgi:hypothetical protein